MNQPSDKEMESAKAYLRKRLEAEYSMRANLEKFMREAVGRIIAIAYKYKMPPEKFRFSVNPDLQDEVNEVIRKLKAQIERATYTLAVGTHKENEDEIITYISRENHGKTFPQRNNIYCNRFKYEVEAAVAAGMILGIAKEKVAQSVTTNLKSPYANPYIQKAMKDRSAATRLISNGISYGAGHTNSMFTALNNLTEFAISEGWMKFFIDDSVRNGAKGFLSFRGSSFPCAICDEETKYVHTLADPLPPYHCHCKCYIVPIF